MELSYKSRCCLLALLMLMSLSAWTQQKNVLSVPDAKVSIGQAQLPVNIENTDEIVAAQFDLTLPSTILAGTDAVLANRCDGHSVIIRNMGATRYRVMLYSDENRPLLAQQGTVFYIPLSIPNTVTEGGELPLVITNATLSVAGGANVLTETKAGKLIVSTLPDLTVKNISLGGDATSAEIIPGERLSLSWQVQNVGGAETGGGWSEQILLVNKRGTVKKLMGTVYQQETLAAGAVMSRQADVTVPQLLGIEGEAYIQVHVISNSETGESALATGNNSAQSDDVFTIGKRLFVELNPARIMENYGRNIAVKLSRSGNWNSEQTFALSSSDDSRVTLPTQVTVPVGQSGTIVYMTVNDNDVLDNDSIVTITASGNDYAAVTGLLIIEDNEYPDLTLTASKSQVTEGETFQLTITTSRVSATPIDVMLTSENIKRFLFPSKVTIPAGETSAQVTVEAVDDELPSLDLTNAFTASASGYNKGEVLVILKDNDLPVLTLELTPNKVSEGAGVVAVAGVLKRTTSTNSKITVKLSDDADGGLYFGNRTLELAKGVEEVHFNFGPVDNAIVDGERTYTITAAVWLSSCNCGASGESAGVVQAQLTVLDNDGPALGITSSLSTVKEGGKTTLTVTRNTTDNSEPLTMMLQSDYDDNLTYNHIVTIPAGQSSATVEVTSNGNDVQGDSHTVVFTAQAEGYATGICYLMVTDQTLPDARISSITVDVTEAEVRTKAVFTIVVTNEGAAELPAEVPVKIYRRGDAGAVGTIYTTEAMPVGSSQTLTKTITLSTTVGTQNYYAVVNESNKIQELSYNNNTSADVAIATVSPFSIAVSTDKTIYKQGEKVIITGQLTGNGIAETDIDIYLVNDGARQVQTVKTDAQGAFSYEWQLYTQQSGHFAVGACYLGEGSKEEMASFDVYGLKRSFNNYITHEVGLGDIATGQVSFYNPGNLALTGVKAEIISVPDNCEASVQIPSSISGGSTIQMVYSLKGTEVSAKQEWNEVKVRLTANEGVSCDVTLYFYCYSQIAQLSANVTHIDATITKGSTREFPLQIVNMGKGTSGEVRLSLPEWMSCQSGTILPSMEFNDTTTIVLLMNTNDRMQLNIPVTGTIGISCANGNGLTINYKVEPVSEEKGMLKVDACDDYTYRTDKAPHVSGAQVVIKHPYTGAEIAKGNTNVDGIFEIELTSGYYKVEVSADKHEHYANYCYINPGKTEYLVANISYQPITVSWSVEETEVDDEYEIVTTVHYETNVPMPVVKIDIPKSIDGDNMAVGDAIVINMVLTNVGLIRADNVEALLPQDMTEWEFVPLGMTEKFTLNPQQTVVIPVQITRIADESKMSTRKKNAAEDMNNNYRNCMAGLAARYEWLCGDDIKNNKAAERMAMKLCAYSATAQAIADVLGSVFGSGGGGLGGPGGHGGSGGGGSTTNYNGVTQTIDICDPCDAEMAERLINTLIGHTWLGMFDKAVNDAISEYQSGGKGDYRFVVKTIGGDIVEKGRDAIIDHFIENGSTMVGYIIEVYKLIQPCEQSADSNRNNTSHPQLLNTRRATKHSWQDDFSEIASTYIEQVKAMDEIMLYIYGDRIWYDELDNEKADFITYITNLEDGYIPSIEELMAHKPSSVTVDQMMAYVDHVLGNEQTSTNELEKHIATYNQINEDAFLGGYESMTDCFRDAFETYENHFKEMKSSSVCASITLKFSQTMTMTRQAFRGTLTVFNGNGDTAMQDVKLTLNVTNRATGLVATSHEFQINPESLNGFSGELDLGSGWTLGANETGTATVLFIPTKYAAPTEPVEWSFGGMLSYIDPFTGLEVTRDLYPVTLTVKPSPELDLTYFMQRDVYGDDPLTEEVEPMKPAEFSLLINNIGNGDAKDVRMMTNQPEIVENEKGLLIDFEILSSQLNGGEKTLALGGSVATDFGNIPAHSQAYAQWWLQSSLLGHFTEYNVQATHVTSYGNPDLTLLNEVTIHELIRSIKVDEGKVTGFVANDLPDAEDMPDIIYFTDGTKADVVVAANAVWKKQSNTEYLLTITPSKAGWNYGHVTDPTYGRATLTGIRRQSDGKEINLRNFWQTDRTLRDGKDWLYENNLHFIDQMGNGTETYVLTFEPRPDMELQVASFEGVPEEGVVLREPLQKVTVTFNKAIDAETFTNEDITLNCQGVRLEGDIIITPISDTQFMLDLSQLTAGNGYYVLTVQTADIIDSEGFNGAAGKTATWVQFTEPTTLALSFYEKEVTYGDSFTEPRILTNSPAVPTFTSTNPLVASVSTEGRVTINAVGTTQVNVALEETPMSDAAQTSYRLTVLQPEGSSEAPAGIKTVSITIPEGQTMTTFCSPWPIDFSDATNDCRAYMAFTYSEDIVECAEVVEAKGGAGLLIVGKPGTYTFPVRTSFYDPIENLFVGTLAPTYVEEMNDDMTNLGLKDIKFVPLNAGVIKANTAYLPIAMDDNVDAMTIVLKAMTGLRIITEQFDEVPWFNISGMKVSRPSAKGIYIHNGRKVVVQ